MPRPPRRRGWSRRSRDRKSTRLNSSHSQISYAVFCLKKSIEPLPSFCQFCPSRPQWTVLSPVWTYKEGTLDGSGFSGNPSPKIVVNDEFPSDRTISVNFKTTATGHNDCDTAWIVGKYVD